MPLTRRAYWKRERKGRSGLVFPTEDSAKRTWHLPRRVGPIWPSEPPARTIPSQPPVRSMPVVVGLGSVPGRRDARLTGRDRRGVACEWTDSRASTPAHPYPLPPSHPAGGVAASSESRRTQRALVALQQQSVDNTPLARRQRGILKLPPPRGVSDGKPPRTARRMSQVKYVPRLATEYLKHFGATRNLVPYLKVS